MTNNTTTVTVPDKKTDLFIRMLKAIEGSAGTLTWTDVAIGATKAAERKRQEAVAALVSGLPLTEILLIEDIAQREVAAMRSKALVEVISERPPSPIVKPANSRKDKKR